MTTLEVEKSGAALDVPAAILQRRSIRHFKTDPIAEPLLKQLLTLTVAAPSSWNLQDWSIILVRDEAQKQALSQAAWGQPQIVEAPVTFVFVADANAADDTARNEEIFQLGREVGHWPEAYVDFLKASMPPFQQALQANGLAREYAVKDALIAATHLMLAAESLGLATVPMNGWTEPAVKAALGMSDQPALAIALLVPVGYPAESKLPSGRLPLHRRVFTGNLNQPYQG